ncbi:MAG: orotidine-5'-phosphate decarboxylase [Planctomycetes bacterium]|nr:orotidine-5'-phosphate decarboxylase [Planctomycetota bacterium]
MHFADRLLHACRKKGNALCAGIDPRWDQLPLDIRNRHAGGTLGAMASAIEEFSLRVLDIVAPLVPIIKPQSAFFEACGPAGMLAQQRVLQKARSLGLITILDNKRGDIATTAEAYADAALAGTHWNGHRHEVWSADALTINPYLGRDAVEPFLASARKCGGGVFVLVRTSNKGAKQFQDLNCDGKPLYQHVAEAVGEWAAENLGACGLGDVGAVVGATHPAELAAVRHWLPHVVFLVPGYGAQGGSAADTAGAFRADGAAAVINSSRGLTACFKPDEVQWESAVERATRAAIHDLTQSTLMKALKG